MATKIYCSDMLCKFNEDGICKSKTVALSAYSVITLYDGRQDFHKCKTFEESTDSKIYREMLDRLRLAGAFKGKETSNANQDR